MFSLISRLGRGVVTARQIATKNAQGYRMYSSKQKPEDKEKEKRKSLHEFLEQQRKKEKERKDDDDKPSVHVRMIQINFNSLLLGVGVVSLLYFMSKGERNSLETNWPEFYTKMLETSLVDRIVIVNKSKAEIYLRSDAPQFMENPSLRKFGFHYFMSIGSAEAFEQRLEEAQRELEVPMKERIPVTHRSEINLTGLIMSISPTLLIIGSLFWLGRRAASGFSGQSGGGILGIGKSRAKMFNLDEKVKIKFSDVAGIDEAKEEVMEFVKFLKEPKIYEELGAKIPRGAILSGPPGTGKTLLAKATAGEAGVPFFSVSGSEFVEMFVGVGASRVRDLFNTAKKHTPCIIFIDEIDAIGKARGRHVSMGGNDERETTLNQILVEMDGFQSSDQIVVLAGTNRLDVLDPALMRPGRFDRHITIDPPDIKGRRHIFEVHSKPIKIAESVDIKELLMKLATLTPGFSGADIRNVCNEAALIAARYNCAYVEPKHFEQAIERIIAGLEKKSMVLSKNEKRIVAYHEAGHAVAGWFLEHSDPLLKVSIIPRGQGALGYAQYLPQELKLYSKEQLEDRMCMTLAGRAAEEIFIKSISTGAADDFKKVTKMVYHMLTQCGMNKNVGMVYFPTKQEEESFTKPFSEETAKLIDQVARDLINKAYSRALELLKSRTDEVHLVAKTLLEKEVINQEDLIKLLGKRPQINL